MYGLQVQETGYLNNFKIVCGKCEKELVVNFRPNPKDPNNIHETIVTYDCTECGHSVSSEKYHAYNEYSKNKLVQKNVEKVARTISEFMNNYSCPMDLLIAEIGKDHPTLQQSFTGLCLKWLQHMAEKQYVDGRNEYSQRLAREILEKVPAAAYRPPMV